MKLLKQELRNHLVRESMEDARGAVSKVDSYWRAIGPPFHPTFHSAANLIRDHLERIP